VIPSLICADERPNLVFLLTDDQTTYSLGCYGNPDVKTPNIDQLSADGVTFDNHYVTTAICMASRVNIMTGLFEYRHGCNFEHGDLMREHWEKSYPMRLRQAGYFTGIAGKVGFEVTDAAGKRGALPEGDFDRWGGASGQSSYETAKNPSMKDYAAEFPHSTRSYGAFGRDFVRDATASGKPFCLSISFKAPHKPATPDPVDDPVYAGQTFTKPANYGRENGEHFSLQSRQGRQYERFESWGYADNYDQEMATYHQQIHAVDVAVGMIRDALAEHGVADNTVVIFTSDNGFFCGSHGYGSKVLPYEEASRVPLIVYDPRHEDSGRQLRSDALTGNVDISPTLLELAGVEVPVGLDGLSLVPLYSEPGADHHASLPLINVWGPEACHSLAVVTRDAKYIYWPYAKKEMVPTEELYHTREDPLELSERSQDPESAESLKAMRALYDGYVADWKAKAVPYHDYTRFGTWFERR
jgi:arylsulfatase A-like enzyme